MFKNWLKNQTRESKPTFTIVEFNEIQQFDEKTKGELQKEILESYKGLDFFKLQFSHEPKSKLIEYLEKYGLPSNEGRIPKNVWQGDFGEILASLVVSYFQGLKVPIKKMRWKFNKDRSLFCTDMFAHNLDGDIKDLFYYEIKTRSKLNKKETVNGIRAYVTVHAHNSLLKDQKSSPEGIANFLATYYFSCSESAVSQVEKEQFRNESLKYGDIVKNSGTYNRHYELFFIGEKSTFVEEILDELNSLPPQLKPLNVTIVLIDNFNKLIGELRSTVISEAVKVVYN